MIQLHNLQAKLVRRKKYTVVKRRVCARIQLAHGGKDENLLPCLLDGTS